MRPLRLRHGILLLVGILVTAWMTHRGFSTWQLWAALRDADRLMDPGNYPRAKLRLTELARRWPDSPEVWYRLGLCEHRLGRFDDALRAWEHVPDGSNIAARTATARAGLAMSLGRFEEAESTLLLALRQAGPHRAEATWELAKLLRFQGRLDAVRDVLLLRLAEGIDPEATLHDLWELDARPVPIDGVRRTLQEAESRSPDDPRVQLGLANLALLTGDLSDAAHRLESLASQSPNDPAIARARLKLALAEGNPDAIESARNQAALQEQLDSPSASATLDAWRAAILQDTASERSALEKLLKEHPTDSAALERLIALNANDPDGLARLRDRKAELDRVRGRYDQIMDSDDPTPPHAEELAKLSRVLRRFAEARAWAEIHLQRRPRDRAMLALKEDVELSLKTSPNAQHALADLRPHSSLNGIATANQLDAVLVPRFVDDSEASGLHFQFDNGRSAHRQLPETMSGGLAVLDYDRDGFMDLYLVQGGPFPPPPDAVCADRLFHNRRDGTFEDVSEAAGLSQLEGGYGHGVTVGDIDNDGYPDLLITRWQCYQLLHNRGDGTFEDQTEATGLGGDRGWPTSAAFADLDGDGDLDLYVCQYLEWNERHPRLCRYSDSGPYQYCNPRHFRAEPDRLFRNDGSVFVDITSEAGIVDEDGRGLGVVAADLDGDGRLDLYVANDMTANAYYRNLGNLRFEEVGHLAGLAGNANGGYQAGMGIARGDLDGDGQLDLAVTNFYGEGTTVYRSLGSGLFCDASSTLGVYAPTRDLLGFGIAMLDANADGRLDLASANGHVTDLEPVMPYAMPAQLLLGTPSGPMVDVSNQAGPAWSIRRLGRGLATGDLDNDGRPDVLLLNQNDPLSYLHNQTHGGHWLVLNLEGTTSNRDGIGAIVRVTAGNRTQVLDRFGGGSYQSFSDPRLHVGLGEADRVDRIEVQWPSGQVNRHDGLAANAGYLLREGVADPQPLPGYAAPNR